MCKAVRRGILESMFSPHEKAADTSLWQDRTMGMDVYDVTISGVGRLVFCDFAGQEYFHGTHGIFFDKSNTIYTMLVNGNDSEDVILQYCHNWCALLSASLPPHSKPIVVMVMSRADLHRHCRNLHDLMDNVVFQMRRKFCSQLNIQQQFFVLDCRKSQSKQLIQFRDFIAKIKEELLQVIRATELIISSKSSPKYVIV